MVYYRENIIKLLKFSDLIFFTIILLILFIFLFYLRVIKLEILFDALESSPLCDFNINKNCGKNSHINFHVLERRIKDKKI